MSEILATVNIGSSAIVTHVVERNAQGSTTLLGQGRASSHGISKGNAIIQSLADAEQNAEVDIRQVSIRSDEQLDTAQIRTALFAAFVEIVKNH
jgi:cell division ATPase FtsA